MKKITASLALMLLLTACTPPRQHLTPTISTGQIPKVCRKWKSGPHAFYASKREPAEVTVSVKAVNTWMDDNNAAREAYCAKVSPAN